MKTATAPAASLQRAPGREVSEMRIQACQSASNSRAFFTCRGIPTSELLPGREWVAVGSPPKGSESPAWHALSAGKRSRGEAARGEQMGGAGAEEEQKGRGLERAARGGAVAAVG